MSLAPLGSPTTLFLIAAAVAIAGGAAVVATCVPPAWFVAVGLGLSVFSGQWGEIGLPFGPDRVLIAMGLLGALFRLLDPRRDERLVLRPLHVLLLATTAYAVCSAVWSGSLTSGPDLFGLLDAFGVVPFLLFALAPVIFAGAPERRILQLTLLAVGAYLGVVGTLEVAGADAVVVPRYISDPNLGIHPDRVRGPFLQAVAMGLALYVCCVAAATVLATSRAPRVRSAAVVVIGLCVIAIVGTVTRSAWLAAVAASVVAMLAARPLRRLLVPVGATVAIVTVASLSLAPGLEGRAAARAEEQRPVWDRMNSNRAAMNMLRERPLLGHGWGAFTRRGDEYYQIVPGYPLTSVGEVHNVFLRNAVELGFAGAGMWLVALAAALSSGLRTNGTPEMEAWRVGLIAIAVAWAITAMFVPLGYAFPNALLWTWAGIVWGSMPRRRAAYTAEGRVAAAGC